MDIQRWLQPISEAAPCGEDLSFSAEFDTLAELRREDDTSLPLGDWKERGKEPKVADWAGACALCERLLLTRSKDLRLGGWLADGWAQQRGLAGLAEGIELVTALAERFWDSVHPQPEGTDQEQRIGALRWLLARVPVLTGLARHVPVVPLQRADALAALQALGRLQAAVDPRLGDEGPSFVPARESLQALVADLPPEPDEPPATAADGTPAPATGAALGSAPASRAQALQQLRLVADYFRRTEPHSPVAYLADKAARWGAMDLHAWLRSVVKDGGSLAHIEELLGVEPPKPAG